VAEKMSIEPEYVDFDVIEEDWNFYEVEDGTIIKAKLVLIKIVREDIDNVGNPIYGLNTQKIFGVIPPKELMGPPSERSYTPEEVVNSIVEEDLEFRVIKENWNEYKLKDGTKLNIKLVITTIARTDLYDQRGEPIYSIQSQILVKAVVPRELRKKLQKYKKSINSS